MNRHNARRYASADVVEILGNEARRLKRIATGWRPRQPKRSLESTLERRRYIAAAYQDAMDLMKNRIMAWEIRQAQEER